MKKLVYALPLLAMISIPTANAATTKDDAARAILTAVNANQKAGSLGYEWRDTSKKLIGPAKEAYRKGEYDKAVTLANTAKEHAELGIQQAKDNEHAGPHF